MIFSKDLFFSLQRELGAGKDCRAWHLLLKGEGKNGHLGS